MLPRRILSLWFPRLSAERILRQEPALADMPLVIVATAANAQSLSSLSMPATALGLQRGMGLSDARALCPDIITRPEEPLRDAAFLTALRRWAGKFSPWVAEEGGEALLIDISGCAHLFGGEEGLAATIEDDCRALRLSYRIGIADTAGAAWAVARFAGQSVLVDRSGDAIDQEARATRSRASKKRKWDRIAIQVDTGATPRIIPPGQTRQVLGPLPVAALRMDADAVNTLTRLGLHTIADVAALPRGALARRIGLDALKRMDQALGSEPEPISPARPEVRFALRLSLPDPIGLVDDVTAAFERLMEPLCTRLKRANQGARRLRLTVFRADGTRQTEELGLARPSWDADRIRPLIHLKLKDIDAGYGIDVVRLEAYQTEPLTPVQHKGHVEAAAEAKARLAPGGAAEFDALLSRLGARVGLEAMTRLSPAESHLPEKTANITAAAFSPPVAEWPAPRGIRPIIMFRPEMISADDQGTPPKHFRWRRRSFEATDIAGPERLTPEWWLDDPDWRTGPRDYWRVTTRSGERLWLFESHGAEISGGWFIHGDFG